MRLGASPTGAPLAFVRSGIQHLANGSGGSPANSASCSATGSGHNGSTSRHAKPAGCEATPAQGGQPRRTRGGSAERATSNAKTCSTDCRANCGSRDQSNRSADNSSEADYAFDRVIRNKINSTRSNVTRYVPKAHGIPPLWLNIYSYILVTLSQSLGGQLRAPRP